MRETVQNIMGHHATILCHTQGINTATQTLATLYEDIRREGIQCDENSPIQFFQWRQSAQLAPAVLRSLQRYVENGDGSRGVRAIYDGEVGITPQTPGGPFLAQCFQPEDQDAK